MGAVLSWLVGGVRLLTGVVLLARTDPSAERWVGSSGPRERYLVRGIGGRDLVIGGGLLHALASGRDPRPWLVASVLGDLTDTVAATGLPEEHATTSAAVAGGFGVLGLVALVLLRD